MKTRIHPLLLIVVLLLSNTSRGMAQQNVSTNQTALFSGGIGTSASPYQIATLADLRFLSENNSYWGVYVYFIQTVDIDAAATNTWNVGNHDNDALTATVAMGFSPIGNGTTNFMGKYDGQGHTISNLYINRPTTQYIGLFGNVNTSLSISNLGLINVDIKGQMCVGGLIGYTQTGTISNVYTSGSVTSNSGGNSNALFGGLVGLNGSGCTISASYSNANVNGIQTGGGGLVGSNDGTIINCYATGNVDGNGSYRGGLVGSNGGSISKSYATGNVNGNITLTTGENFGGLVGRNRNTTITDCYATGNVTGYKLVGGLVGYNLASGGTATINRCYSIGIVSAAVSTSLGGLIGYNGGTCTNSFWDIETSGINNSSGGTGKTTIEMKKLSTFTTWNITVGSGTWQLKLPPSGFVSYPYLRTLTYDELNASVVVKPIPGLTVFTYFSGGAGTAIDPYKIATLSDLMFLSENIDTWNKYYIQTADIDATATNTWNVGDHDLNAATPTVAMGFSPIGNSNNQYTGNYQFTGNYDGQNHTITALTINRPSTQFIGLFGAVNSSGGISNLGLLNISVSGQVYVGGLIGWAMAGTFSNVYTTGSVTANSGGNSSANLGGLVGFNASGCTITNSYSKANISGVKDLFGGLVGFNYGTIINCYATGNLVGDGSFRGGLVGENGGPISKSYATGNVNGNINNTTGYYFGGLVGRNREANISDCYATGRVAGYSHVGGLVGYYLVTSGTYSISNSYATGAISCTHTLRGGLVGAKNSEVVTNCFWDTQTTGISTSFGGTGKTTPQLKTQTTFTNWNFSTTPVWKINTNNNGYPYLAWQNYPIVAPTTQASALVFTSVTNYGMTIGWTNGNGAARAVYVKEGTGAISNPVNQTTYTASSDWATKGTQLASSDYYCVYNGNGNSVSITNLTKNTTYSIQVIEYDGGAGTEVYCTTSGTNNPLSQATTNEGGTGLSSNNATNLILFPNPANDAFRIQGLSEISAISITDLSGKTVLQQQVSTDEAVFINTLPKGVYVLKIKNKNGVAERKLVKE